MPIEERIAPREIRSLLVGISSAFGALLFVAIVLAMYFGGEPPSTEAAAATVTEPVEEATDSQYRRPWAPDSEFVDPEAGGPDGEATGGSLAAQDPTANGPAASETAAETGQVETRTVVPSAGPPTRPTASSAGEPSVGVRVGVFSVQSYADRAAEQLRAAGYEPLVVLTQLNGRVVRYVYAGVYRTESEAQAAIRRIETHGFDTVIEQVIGTPPSS